MNDAVDGSFMLQQFGVEYHFDAFMVEEIGPFLSGNGLIFFPFCVAVVLV